MIHMVCPMMCTLPTVCSKYACRTPAIDDCHTRVLSLPTAKNMLLGMYFQFICSFHVLPRSGGSVHTLTSLHEVAFQSGSCGKAAAPHTVTMIPAFCYAALLSSFAPSSPGASKLPVKGFLCYLSSPPTLPRLLYESSLL